MKTGTYLNEPKEMDQENVLTELLLHHLNSFINHDLKALMSDYTDESFFITPDAIYTGPKEIEVFFTNLLAHFPKQGSQFKLDKIFVKDNLGFIVWHAATPTLNLPFGTDTFIVRDQKIVQQTFAGQFSFTS